MADETEVRKAMRQTEAALRMMGEIAEHLSRGEKVMASDKLAFARSFLLEAERTLPKHRP